MRRWRWQRLMLLEEQYKDEVEERWWSGARCALAFLDEGSFGRWWRRRWRRDDGGDGEMEAEVDEEETRRR